MMEGPPAQIIITQKQRIAQLERNVQDLMSTVNALENKVSELLQLPKPRKIGNREDRNEEQAQWELFIQAWQTRIGNTWVSSTQLVECLSDVLPGEHFSSENHTISLSRSLGQSLTRHISKNA